MNGFLKMFGGVGRDPEASNLILFAIEILSWIVDHCPDR